MRLITLLYKQINNEQSYINVTSQGNIMAVLPLNTFKTIAKPVPTTKAGIYTCPTGYTAIILLAQVSNVGTQTSNMSFIHVRLNNETFLVKNAPIPIEDALSVLTGRLVLQDGDSIRIQGSPDIQLQIVLSIVESANA